MSVLTSLRLRWARQRCRLPAQAVAFAKPLPVRRAPVDILEILALDFETTGLNTSSDRILSAGWVVIRNGRIELASADEVRVRPDGDAGVGQSAVIHGIVDSDLDDAMDESGLLDVLMPLIAGRVVAAHAAMIERGFLNSLLRRLGGVRLPHTFVDTLNLERRLLEGQGMRAQEYQGALTLPAARARYGLPAHSQHSAASDALACAELLLAQIAMLDGRRRPRLADIA